MEYEFVQQQTNNHSNHFNKFIKWYLFLIIMINTAIIPPLIICKNKYSIYTNDILYIILFLQYVLYENYKLYKEKFITTTNV